ncbi:MAG TPA: FimV/HubP family polar landmark protein [Rhodanobacteraceae bacterium]
MSLKLRIACAALLATASLPALALQLGEIQVKSALNQPLVAAIPLHPASLTELDGLTVSLASSADFARAGLPLTATDQTLRFHVVTDNNGQKLILVTSSQPVTDPYLDFLVQVNTHAGKQVREFVVLLNPVIESPAPAVEEAPVASAPSNNAVATQPAELPAPTQFPQPQSARPAAPPPPQAKPKPQPQSTHAVAQPTPPPAVQPQPQAAAAPAHLNNAASGPITVKRGENLYQIARRAIQGTDTSIDQMMLAMQAANPDAFFKHNINDLKAGAILRIPTRDQIDQHSAAAAAAEVHRQYESWRSVKPHPATVVEGTAAQAAANAAPKPTRAAPASDHLTLVPPSGAAGGANNRPGVAGGTGSATVAGLQQQLKADQDTLVSLSQSNADLASRVQSLKDISAKTGKLLSLKDAMVAELQRKLAATGTGAAAAGSAAKAAGATKASASKTAATPATHAKAAKPAAPATSAPWFMRPLAWVVAGIIALALIVLAVLGRRRGKLSDSVHGPLPDPEDVAPEAAAPIEYAAATPASTAEDTGAADYASEHAHADTASEDPYGLAALRRPVQAEAAVAEAIPTDAAGEAPWHAPEPAHPDVAPVPVAESADPDPDYSSDPVDTKLDLARAYLDMGDPVGARAMLEEVLEEGTQMQKDEATKLLAEATS